jgi:hypothetical protein
MMSKHVLCPDESADFEYIVRDAYTVSSFFLLCTTPAPHFPLMSTSRLLSQSMLLLSVIQVSCILSQSEVLVTRNSRPEDPCIMRACGATAPAPQHQPFTLHQTSPEALPHHSSIKADSRIHSTVSSHSLPDSVSQSLTRTHSHAPLRSLVHHAFGPVNLFPKGYHRP